MHAGSYLDPAVRLTEWERLTRYVIMRARWSFQSIGTGSILPAFAKACSKVSACVHTR